MAKKTEKELEIQRLDKKTPLQMFRDYVMITVASFVTHQHTDPADRYLEIWIAVYFVDDLLYGNDITVYKPADTGWSSDHRSITCLSGRKCPDGSIHGLGVQGRIHYGRDRYYYQITAVEVPVPQDGSIVFPDRCGYCHSIGICIPEH